MTCGSYTDTRGKEVYTRAEVAERCPGVSARGRSDSYGEWLVGWGGAAGARVFVSSGDNHNCPSIHSIGYRPVEYSGTGAA
jgi:hypothetical protein